MKLIFCSVCEDIVRLWPGYWRSCSCGQAYGRYSIAGLAYGENARVAEVGGCAIPFGIPNPQFVLALQNRSIFPAFFYGVEVPDNGDIVIREVDKETRNQESVDALREMKSQKETHDRELSEAVESQKPL